MSTSLLSDHGRSAQHQLVREFVGWAYARFLINTFNLVFCR